MRDGVTVEFDVHFARGRAGRREVLPGKPPAKPELPEGSVPRVARLMALAIRCEELVRRGEVADYADLARLGHVSRARLTQIVNLLNLAPNLQEEILFLPRTTKGRDPIGERDLRPIHLVNTDPPYNVKVEPRSNNAIAAGLSSFGEHRLMHHQSFGDRTPRSTVRVTNGFVWYLFFHRGSCVEVWSRRSAA